MVYTVRVARLLFTEYTVHGAPSIAKRGTVFNPGGVMTPGVFLWPMLTRRFGQPYNRRAMQDITLSNSSSAAPIRAASATRLLCRSAVKQFTLDTLKDRRPHLASKMTRVGSNFYVVMEARLRNAIVGHIDALPSKGKTIR